jgi:hypothetical protein
LTGTRTDDKFTTVQFVAGFIDSFFARKDREGGVFFRLKTKANSFILNMRGKLMESDKDEVIAFGMTMQDIIETTEAISKYKDDNHPTKSGSYDDFLSVKSKGHKALLAQEGYGKIN